MLSPIINKASLPVVLVLLSFVFPFSAILSQDIDENYQRFRIGELKEIHSGIAVSPRDGHIVAISGNKSTPVYIYNWQDDKIQDKINVENWYAGSSIEYSRKGNYLVLNQLFYADWAANRDKKVTFLVLDKNGNKVLRLEDSNETKITPDEKSAVSMSGNQIITYDLASGKQIDQFTIPGKGFAFDISPDGEYLAIAHQPVEDELKALPQFKKDKKALKDILKYKHQVSIYSFPDHTRIGSVNEFYDFVYELKFRKDGSQLFCLQIPHQKVQTSVGSASQTYVNIINTAGWEPIRAGFVSKSYYQPDFKLSDDGRFFGIVSYGYRYPELHIYDYETLKLLDRFEFTFRIIESDEDGIIAADTRPSFVFLPDDDRIMVAFGNRLFLWNFKQQ